MHTYSFQIFVIYLAILVIFWSFCMNMYVKPNVRFKDKCLVSILAYMYVND